MGSKKIADMEKQKVRVVCMTVDSGVHAMAIWQVPAGEAAQGTTWVTQNSVVVDTKEK